MTLAEKLREIIATEDAALDAPPPGRPFPMDRDGLHMWQRTWAEWARYIAHQRCACGAMPPPEH